MPHLPLQHMWRRRRTRSLSAPHNRTRAAALRGVVLSSRPASLQPSSLPPPPAIATDTAASAANLWFANFRGCVLRRPFHRPHDMHSCHGTACSRVWDTSSAHATLAGCPRVAMYVATITTGTYVPTNRRGIKLLWLLSTHPLTKSSETSTRTPRGVFAQDASEYTCCRPYVITQY